MQILNTKSMIATIDNVNDALLTGQKISKADQFKIANWISGQYNPALTYSGLFSPTAADVKSRKDIIKMYTGEAITGARGIHYVGQEAARIIALFQVKDAKIKIAYERASAWMSDHKYFRLGGTHCCGTCTAAFWRHFTVGHFSQKEEALSKAIQSLKADRKEGGRWRRYPFFYTVLALLDFDSPSAVAEIKYTRPVLERYVKRNSPVADIHTKRKRTIATKALEKVS